MRIAHVVPPWYPVPPTAYGGIENLVADLAAATRRRGHEVAVVAPGDSDEPSLLAALPRSRPLDMGLDTVSVLHAAQAEAALRGWRPDVVHDHTVTAPLMAPGRSAPTVMTVHGAAGGDVALWAGHAAAQGDLVAISRSQADLAPQVRWTAVVPNGVDVHRYPAVEGRRSADLVFLGRLGPDKGCAEAIAAARAAGRRLLVAGRISRPEEVEYVERHVRPHLGADVVYLGELGFEAKTQLLQQSAALIFPLQWDEPYGLVVAEAAACGTPVVTLARGAMPELVVEGVTGFVCRAQEELVDAIGHLEAIDPRACRRHAEEVLTIERTAAGYERVYTRALDRRLAVPRLVRAAPDVSPASFGEHAALPG